MTSTGANPSARAQTAALALVLIVGFAFACGILAGIDELAGPQYWRWPPRDLGLARTLAFLAPALIPFFFAWRDIERTDAPRSVVRPLILLVVTCLAMQSLALLCHPDGIEHLRAIVMSPRATSYFTDAQNISGVMAWLRGFHTYELGLHSATHPPGPVLYYYAWQQLLPAPTAALAGGITVGLVASLGVPVMYAFAGLWTDERRSRLLACAMYALLPALAFFLPDLDQIYPIFAMLLALSWAKALRGSRAHALLFAATLFVSTFFAYNLLVVGAFVVLYAAYFLRLEHASADAWRRLIVSALIGAAGLVIPYVVLWVAASYDPLRSLAHAIGEQNELSLRLMRPWFSCLFTAPYDFFIGAGMVMLPLLVLSVRRLFISFDIARRDLVLSAIALATILIVDLSGLLRAENARVWLFLQPFAIVPAALELERFGPRGRLAVFAMQWFVGAVLFCRLAFVYP